MPESGMLTSSLGVLRGPDEPPALFGIGSKKLAETLELVRKGKTSWFAGGIRLSAPLSAPWPESTRETVGSSLATGDGIGESSTPILVLPDFARLSFEGGWI
jgi:hypothetical protein